MIDLTLGNAVAAGTALVTAFWAFYLDIQRKKEAHKLSTAADVEKHKATTAAELDKQKASIEAEAKKAEVKELADVEREKAKHQAEVDKVREQGMGGQAVAKIWQAVDNIKDDVAKLEDNQAKDHSDNLLRNQIVTSLHEEVSKFTKLIFENFITRR